MDYSVGAATNKTVSSTNTIRDKGRDVVALHNTVNLGGGRGVFYVVCMLG